MSNRGIITKALRNRKPESKRYTDLTVDIATHIQDILDAKGWTQKDLAEKMGRQNSEISKWLTGTHNFTLKTLSQIESMIGEEVVFSKKQAVNRFSPFNPYFHEFMNKYRHSSKTKRAKKEELNANYAMAA